MFLQKVCFGYPWLKISSMYLHGKYLIQMWYLLCPSGFWSLLLVSVTAAQWTQEHFFFWRHQAACGILVPQPGIEPTPPAVEAQSLNHWTAKEVPRTFFFLAALGLRCYTWAFFSCVEGGYSSLGCADLSLQWLLLLQITGSRCVGFSSCGLRALERRLSSCGTRA